MTWIEPKTNWVASDYFNISDYNRIVGNITHINNLMNEMYQTVSIGSVPQTKTYTDFPYADEFNTIRSNLSKINTNTYKFSPLSNKTYVDNGTFATYNDLNEIERLTLRIYQYLVTQKQNLKRLSFTLNGQKGFKV